MNLDKIAESILDDIEHVTSALSADDAHDVIVMVKDGLDQMAN